MKKILGNLFIKILAVIMVCVMAPVFFMSTFCAAEAYDENLYERDTGFVKSNICRNFITNSLAELREQIYWDDIEGIMNRKEYENSNFGFRILDSKNQTVYSNMGNGKSYKLVVEGYPAREVDSEGKVVAEYKMNGYISNRISTLSDGWQEYNEFQFYRQNRWNFLYLMGISFLVCSVLCLYLIIASGWNSKGELALRGLNGLDYDIMLFLAAIGGFGIINLLSDAGWRYDNLFMLAYIFVLLMGLTAIVLAVIMSSSAHFKTKQWWKHTFIWQCLALFSKCLRWFFSSMSLTWKLALAVAGYSFVIYILGILSNEHGIAPFAVLLAVLLALFAAVGGICAAMWFGVQLKKIKRGGEAIANGDFDYRINSKELWPSLRGHAYNLNSAALGMSKAVDDRMKSERFKTELITNVSHDLKTPLTSIVSYVDLLKKEQIENEAALGYIEVIDRQSAKLKKLTEDLVEASKASSGAVAVNKEVLDIGELINQSVGEYSEKLEAAEIFPVINLPENEMKVFTDGRLLWRVFDNLIQNIIKYAQPGTRAYFDLSEAEENAVLTIRNISKEPLNMSAEALMERFVRGDASRNSEGNGLGLSIAKSLTELCGGTFELMLDGDLYKIVISIPKIGETPEE